jgi:prepilin-type processing-associated H-X9-DG protein
MARAFGKKIACQANLKQLACAWTMYLEHYDGYFYQEANANVKYGGWRGIIDFSPRPLNKMVGLAETLDDERTAGIYCCPADRGGVIGKVPSEKAYHYLGTSYQTNQFLIGYKKFNPMNPRTEKLDKEISSRLERINISRVTASPAYLLLMGDQGWVYQWTPMAPLIKTMWERQYKSYAEWHIRPDSYNMAFLDGHTAFVKIRKVYYITDDYTVIPFKDLTSLAHQVQGEDP